MEKSSSEILKSAINCIANYACGDCRYYCVENICCRDMLADDLKRMQREKNGGEYWDKISELNAKQEIKGKKKYGISLEENTSLTTEQRIEHLQEELIDGLKYCEHLKVGIRDNGITANDYQMAALRTAGDDKDTYLLNGVMGLCGEAGEVIDAVKKVHFQGHKLDTDKVAEELGDVLWYCALIASAIDYPLGHVMQMNIDKLKKRYPEGFSKERSINRNDSENLR